MGHRNESFFLEAEMRQVIRKQTVQLAVEALLFFHPARRILFFHDRAQRREKVVNSSVDLLVMPVSRADGFWLLIQEAWEEKAVFELSVQRKHFQAI